MMKYLFVILAVLSLAACRSSRDLSKTPSSTPEHTSETKTKAEHYVKRVCANAQTEKTITARIKMSLNAGGKDISAGGTLRMKRDDVRANCDIFIDSYEELDLSRVLSFEG